MTQPVTHWEATDPAPSAGRAGRREWLSLAALALPCLLVSLDSSVLGLAVPRLAADLHPSGPQLLWIMDSYTFLVAGSLLTMGVVATGSDAGACCCWGRGVRGGVAARRGRPGPGGAHRGAP